MTITTVGKNGILDRMFGLSAVAAFSATGVGASATASAITDTQLTTTPTLQVFDSATRASNVVTTTTTFATGTANIVWQEVGIFNGTTNGTSLMLDRIAPIGPFTKTSAVSIVLVITITQS